MSWLTPFLRVNLMKILQNTENITRFCKEHSVNHVAACTKCVCGDIDVAQMMISGGAAALADSRLQNLKHLRNEFPDTELLLLRFPMKGEVTETVTFCDMSLNSEYSTLKLLNDAAERQETTHGVILMVESGKSSLILKLTSQKGDLREGIFDPFEDVVGMCHRILTDLPHLHLAGIGSNFSCFGGVSPDKNNIDTLLSLKCRIETELSHPLQYISGGNSTSLDLLPSLFNSQINHIRIGEGILLGLNPLTRLPFSSFSTHTDAFSLHAEIIELKEKPHSPWGLNFGQTAFGEEMEIESDVPNIERTAQRAILGIGRQDVDVDGLEVIDEGIKVVGASSDHMIVEILDEVEKKMQVGDVVSFTPNYSALLALCTSQYVNKVKVRE